MYSTYNEGKSVVTQRFIRTFKNQIFKHMTAASKSVYFNALIGSVNKYNNTMFITKVSEIITTPLCLGNISRTF